MASERFSPYTPTGDLNAWFNSIGISGCVVELDTNDDPQFERNLAALRVIFDLLRDGVTVQGRPGGEPSGG